MQCPPKAVLVAGTLRTSPDVEMRWGFFSMVTREYVSGAFIYISGVSMATCAEQLVATPGVDRGHGETVRDGQREPSRRPWAHWVGDPDRSNPSTTTTNPPPPQQQPTLSWKLELEHQASAYEDARCPIVPIVCRAGQNAMRWCQARAPQATTLLEEPWGEKKKRKELPRSSSTTLCGNFKSCLSHADPFRSNLSSRQSKIPLGGASLDRAIAKAPYSDWPIPSVPTSGQSSEL